MSIYRCIKQGIASIDAALVGYILSTNARNICNKHSEWIDLTIGEKRMISPLDYYSFKAFKNLGDGGGG